MPFPVAVEVGSLNPDSQPRAQLCSSLGRVPLSWSWVQRHLRFRAHGPFLPPQSLPLIGTLCLQGPTRPTDSVSASRHGPSSHLHGSSATSIQGASAFYGGGWGDGDESPTSGPPQSPSGQQLKACAWEMQNVVSRPPTTSNYLSSPCMCVCMWAGENQLKINNSVV